MSESKGRHELKHYINYSDVLQLRNRLPFVMKIDENSDGTDGYRVKSLYFDNYDDKVLREKLDGLNKREKYRLRYYNDDLSFIRIEKKSKVNGISYKESVEITCDECRRIINGDISALLENGKPLCQELYSKMKYQLLRPKNIVDYKREAFIHSMGNVRVTLDYDIRSSNNIYDFLNKDMVTVPIIGTYILEVKYDNYLPEIIRGMVSLSSRRSTAFSKYAVTRII